MLVDSAEQASSPPVSLWPVWRFDSGYAELARYVTPEAITLDFDFRVPLTEEEAARSEAELDLLRAERLYRQLAAREIRYEEDPWASEEGVQQIRHPWWLFAERLGNCLDISLAYAGLCMAARTGVLLAVTEDHAFVVLTPERLHLEGARDALYELAGFDSASDRGSASDPGVLAGTGAALEAAIAESRVVAVDVVGATTEGFDFSEATTGRPWLSNSSEEHGEEKVWLVDVPHLQTKDRYAERPHPVSFRPSIRQRIPSGGEFREFATHAEVLAELRDEDGMHVLIGESGRGKSTIARHLAENARDGAAWFLDASDRKALCNSLAEAMFAERSRSGLESLDDASERKTMWETAKAHLRETNLPWLVVLDNANGDPGTLRDLLPDPKPGQMLLVTTTNPQWAEAPGFTAHPLKEVGVGDLGRFGQGEIADLIEGRPLLLEAFERLAEHSRWDGESVPTPGSGLRAELRGPDAFWSLLREEGELGDTASRTASFAAYLPANGQPVEVLERLVPGAGQALDRLVEAGLLVRDRNAGEVRMHRLFGEAIRRDLENRRPELCDEISLAAMRDEAARVALDQKGDPETIARLDRRLAALDAGMEEPDFEFGVVLQNAAELLELHGSTRLSGKTYARAERHVKGDARRLADCLQGRARTVNQHHTDERVMLEDAIEWAQRAHSLLLNEASATPAAAARCYAMQGLLMKALANLPVPGKSKSELLHEALDVLEEANDQRQESDEIGEPEKQRSKFNLAGIKIPLAQQERDRAEEYLDEAHEIYEQVGDARRLFYGRMNHPHIAACENGLALVGYYRAMLLPASRQRQSQWLRDATKHATQALHEREIIDGSIDVEEAPKSAALLAKIALARNASPVGALRDTEGLLNQAKRELTNAGRALAQVPLPSSDADLEGAIGAWARSRALRVLIEEWDGEPPEGDLGELLAWQEEFSSRWNFRRAKGERNDVDRPQLSLLTEKVVKASAKALGLIKGGSKPEGRYDQVLILGGKARGCLSRPSLAAGLIGGGKIEAGSVVALGGFRVLDDQEKTLVEKVGGGALTNEFEAMETGVRRAFELGSPRSKNGIASDLIGGAWRIHTYDTPTGLPVSVIAAPSSEPEERRANTPDTFAWFATEVAKLEPGQRVLVVTTDIYVPYQHADALRLLALPYGVEVDTVGVVPGEVDRRLAHSFEAHNYLQEIRSAILSLRRLHTALSERA